MRRAQELLEQLGFSPGPADGLLGAQTVEAIREFRRRVSLVDANLQFGDVASGLLLEPEFTLTDAGSDERMTYAELDGRARALAGRLIKACAAGERVLLQREIPVATGQRQAADRRLAR